MTPPPKQGLYDPKNEHDSCGVAFVAHSKGVKSHDIVRQGLQILVNLEHRGAVPRRRDLGRLGVGERHVEGLLPITIDTASTSE